MRIAALALILLAAPARAQDAPDAPAPPDARVEAALKALGLEIGRAHV